MQIKGIFERHFMQINICILQRFLQTDKDKTNNLLEKWDKGCKWEIHT